MDISALQDACTVLYESTDQAARAATEAAMISALGTEAGLAAAQRVVEAHGSQGGAQNVHLVCSHPSSLPGMLGALASVTPTHPHAGIFAATCIKGCVSEYYHQFPPATAAQLQKRLWSVAMGDGSPGRLSKQVQRSVLFTVVRLASLAWVDDESVREVPRLCLARLVATHAGSRSIIGMDSAAASAPAGAAGTVAAIPMEVATYVVTELVRTLAVGEGSTPAPAVVLRAYRPFLHDIVAHAFSVARVTAESVTQHVMTAGAAPLEAGVWNAVQRCVAFAGKCLEEVRAVRLLLASSSSARDAESVLDYDYLPRASATAALVGLTDPAAVKALASLAVTLGNRIAAPSAEAAVSDDDPPVRVAVACMTCLGHMALLKISSYTDTLQDWITAMTEALQVAMTLTATGLASQYRSGMGMVRQVAAARAAGGTLALVTTHSWLHALCQLLWSLMARISISKLAQRGVVSKERLDAVHLGSVMLLQHWYAVPAGGIEYLLKAWAELARGAGSMAASAPGMYEALGLHQHVVDMVACITAYHVQLGAVASLDGCGGWELMDNADACGALRTALYPVPVPGVRAGSEAAPDALTGAMAQMKQGDWVDEFNDSAETRRALYLMLKQCALTVLGGVCRFYEGTLFNFTRHALGVADQCVAAASARQDPVSVLTLKVVGALLRGQCASLMRNLSSLLWPLTMVHKPDTLLVKEGTAGGVAAPAPPARKPVASPAGGGARVDPTNALTSAVASLMGQLLGDGEEDGAAAAAAAISARSGDVGVDSLAAGGGGALTAAAGAAVILQWMFDVMLLSLGACLPRVATGSDPPEGVPAGDDGLTLSGVAQKGLDMTNAALEALVADLAAVSLGDPTPAAPTAPAAVNYKALSPEAARRAVSQLHALMFASGAVTASERSHTWLEGNILDCFTPFWHVYVKERRNGALAVTSSKLRAGLNRAAMSISSGTRNPLHGAGLPSGAAGGEGGVDPEGVGITPLLARFLSRMKLTYPHQLVDMMMMKLVANLRAGEASGEAGVRACPVSGGVDQVVTQTVVTFTSMVDHVVPRSSSSVMAALPPALTDLLCTLTVRTLVTKSPAVLFPLLSHPKYGRWRTYVYLALSRLLFSHARVLSSPTQPLDAAASGVAADGSGGAADVSSLLEEALKAEVVQQLGIADGSAALEGMAAAGPMLGALPLAGGAGPTVNPVTGQVLGASAVLAGYDFATGAVAPGAAPGQGLRTEEDTADALDDALRKVAGKTAGGREPSAPPMRPAFPSTRLGSLRSSSRHSVASMVPHLTAKLTNSGALALRALGPDWFLGFITPLEAVGATLHTLLSTGLERAPTGALLGQAVPPPSAVGAGGVVGGGGSARPSVHVEDNLLVRVVPDAGRVDPAAPTGLVHAVAFMGRVTPEVAGLLHAASKAGGATAAGAARAVTISLSDKFAVIGWLRDLRGLVWATANGSEYGSVFTWFRHRHIHLLPAMASAFRHDFDVLKPLVRLCLTLANNTTHRVTFSPHDGGGALLYRTTTRVIGIVVENLLAGTLKHAAKTAITSSAGQLTEEAINIKMVRLLCTAADCVLSGQFVNPALLAAMDDSAPADLRRAVVQVTLSVTHEQLQGFAKLPPTWSHVLVSLLRYDRGAGAAVWGMPSPVVGSLLERLLVLTQTHAGSRQRAGGVDDDGSRHCEDPRVFSSAACILKHLLTPLVRAQYTVKLAEQQAAQRAAEEAAGAPPGMSVPLGVDPALHNLFLARHRVSELGLAKAAALLKAFEAVTRQRPQLWRRYLHLLLFTALSCPPSSAATVAQVLAPPMVLLLYCLPNGTIEAAVADVVKVVCHTVSLTGAAPPPRQAQQAADLLHLLQALVTKTVQHLDTQAGEAVAKGVAFSSTTDHLVEAPWVTSMTRQVSTVREVMDWAAAQQRALAAS